MNRRWLWLTASVVGLVLVMAGSWMLTSQTVMSAETKAWLAHPIADLPSTIGPDDGYWEEATPFYLPLHAGSHGPPTAEAVELRALYDEVTIAFRARWSGAETAQLDDRFALIWHKDDLPGQRGQDCATACHVARSGHDGNIQSVIPSFVPAGREEPLPTQATWREGQWTLVWSRPLHSFEARDIQFVDLDQRYRVRAKVFLDLNQKPDLLTEDTHLTFTRNAP